MTAVNLELSLANMLFAATLDSRAMDRLLEFVRVKSGADAALMRILNVIDMSYPITLARGDLFSEDFFREYDDGLILRDPQVRIGLEHRLERGAAFLCHEHFSAEDRQQDPFFNEFLPRHNIGWSAGILVQFEPTKFIAFGLSRRPASGPFSTPARRVLEILAAVLEDWTPNFSAMQELRLVNNAISAISHSKTDCAFVIDQTGSVLWSDRDASELVNQIDAVKQFDETLTIDRGSAFEAFIDQVRSLAGPQGAAENAVAPMPIQITLATGARLEFSAKRVRADHFPGAGFAGALVTGKSLLAIVDPTAPGAGDIKKLSAKEYEIAQLICEGRKTPEIAKALEVAPSTVLTHQKRAYRKLGIKSKQALVALFAEFRK